ncbi:MAG: hypothetical protein J3K34DRAFT_438424 [Monoraphidium minutum]|nr:MAG: hypothetical protein J3K34DRAFT_438424 [Monoraphidium minutum]
MIGVFASQPQATACHGWLPRRGILGGFRSAWILAAPVFVPKTPPPHTPPSRKAPRSAVKGLRHAPGCIAHLRAQCDSFTGPPLPAAHLPSTPLNGFPPYPPPCPLLRPQTWNMRVPATPAPARRRATCNRAAHAAPARAAPPPHLAPGSHCQPLARRPWRFFSLWPRFLASPRPPRCSLDIGAPPNPSANASGAAERRHPAGARRGAALPPGSRRACSDPPCTTQPGARPLAPALPPLVCVPFACRHNTPPPPARDQHCMRANAPARRPGSCLASAATAAPRPPICVRQSERVAFGSPITVTPHPALPQCMAPHAPARMPPPRAAARCRPGARRHTCTRAGRKAAPPPALR